MNTPKGRPRARCTGRTMWKPPSERRDARFVRRTVRRRRRRRGRTDGERITGAIVCAVNLNAPASRVFRSISSFPEVAAAPSRRAALPRASQAIAADSRARASRWARRPQRGEVGKPISANPNRSKASDVYNVAEAPRLSNSSPQVSSQHSNNFSMRVHRRPHRSTCSLAIEDRSTSRPGSVLDGGGRRPRARHDDGWFGRRGAMAAARSTMVLRSR